MMPLPTDAALRLARTAVSYLPSPSLLRLRRLSDFGAFGKPHEVDFLCFGHLPPQRQIFLDVGANRGQSIRSIGLVLDDVAVVAVEPNPMLAEALKRDSDSRILAVHNVALSDSPSGELVLHLPRYGHTIYDTRAAASADQAEKFLDKRWFAFFDESRSGVEQLSAPIATIDQLAVEPTIVKIDVEGADLEVIRGGEETLRAQQPLILIEEPGPASVEFLRDLGYRPFRFDGQRLICGDTGGLNTFFLTTDHERLFSQGALELVR